jgi:hypothetical protein
MWLCDSLIQEHVHSVRCDNLNTLWSVPLPVGGPKLTCSLSTVTTVVTSTGHMGTNTARLDAVALCGSAGHC